jgi:hypothetical protein
MVVSAARHGPTIDVAHRVGRDMAQPMVFVDVGTCIAAATWFQRSSSHATPAFTARCAGRAAGV